MIATWWEASAEERTDLLKLLDEVRALLDERYSPDGWNVGFNSGAAAGQTVDHLHVHLIPRYHGDMPDPRGGVRHVIPWKGNYLAPASTGTPQGPLSPPTPAATVELATKALPHILEKLRSTDVERVDIVVSFVRRSGLRLVLPDLLDALDRDVVVRLLTTDYLGITEPAALEQLLDLSRQARSGGSLDVRVFRDPGTSFHAKAWIFTPDSSRKGPSALVGSSNLTGSGLQDGIEWNVHSTNLAEAGTEFETLWSDDRAVELTPELLDEIEAQPRPAPMARSGLTAEVPETPYDADDEVEWFEPNEVQEEALGALAASRQQGHRAGLVVMATGLGKTYLAAFDARATRTDRVLFVAHRKEILEQARDSFRDVLPEARMGMLVDGQDDMASAEFLFASVQSLATRIESVDPDAYRYVVVDEFHHAAADSYRRVIDHLAPDFLLGLTATPDRLDGGDILALCGDNEVYRCDLVEGIQRDLLAPFHYHGVLDPTDYAVVPWRRGRFREDDLANAVSTEERARLVYEEWQTRRGRRTLAFCVSQSHADFMAAWFAQHGIRAAAVHSGPSSAPRRGSIRALEDGELEVLFSVDIFNEGFDVPAIDTVLMLRPTESPVIFLQQLGRGLRIAEDKDRLTVIDLIGNHESFLLKPRILLSMATGRTATTAELRSALEAREFHLPPECTIEFEVGVIDLFGQLLATRGTKGRDRIDEYVLSHLREEGRRPSKVQVFHAGLNPGALRQPWFTYLEGLDALEAEERAAASASAAVLQNLERTVLANLSKAYKLVTLRALVRKRALRDGLSVEELVEEARRIILGDPRLVADVTSSSFSDPRDADVAEWEQLWRKNPIRALTTPTRGVQLFELEGDVVRPRFQVAQTHGAEFDQLVGELVDYRMATYLVGESEDYILRVTRNGNNPIIRFDRKKHPKVPHGDSIPFLADGQTYYGDFRKIALNVARRGNSDQNDLPELLRGWFGDDAGAPGTAHQVALRDSGAKWVLEPAQGRRSGGWPDEQIEILLDHYFTMLDDEQAGRSYVKAEHNRQIQEETGRSRGSIEFKLANVSAVLDELGQPFIDGYKPRENYQESLRPAVEARLRTRRDQ